MKYQIHRNIVIDVEAQERPLVLVSRTETFSGTLEELKDHLVLFEYDCDNAAKKQLEKHAPTKPIETSLGTSVVVEDEIPF